MIGSNFPTLSILLLSVWAKTAQSFQCYTGDGRVMRRKTCPTLGDMKFTDLCFQTYGESHTPKSITGVLAVIINCLRKTFPQLLQFCLLLCSQLRKDIFSTMTISPMTISPRVWSLSFFLRDFFS